MPPYTVETAASLPGPEWLRARRVAAMERFLARPRPTDADEIWRYSRVGDLDVDRYEPVPVAPSAGPPSAGPASAGPASAGRTDQGDRPPMLTPILEALQPIAGLAITVDGTVRHLDSGPDLSLTGLTPRDADIVGTSTVEPWDAFVDLNAAMLTDAVVLRVPPGVTVREPVVVCHWVRTEGSVAFPRTVIDVGANAAVAVVELFLSDDVDAWVAPVLEATVGDGARLEHQVVQLLGPRVWSTDYHSSTVARSATLREFTVALGGDYARVRTDSRLVDAGGSTDLLALYFGDGAQMHDFRTLQDHDGAKTTSDLVFKGAVMDEARSAYSGLIRVRPGARGTKAFQTNRNLVLSDTGLATYSVPNLDIAENDVSCSHASATGPIDADQRFYLESRGVPATVAERLIVLGFFADLLERLPVAALRPFLLERIAAKLERAESARAAI